MSEPKDTTKVASETLRDDGDGDGRADADDAAGRGEARNAEMPEDEDAKRIEDNDRIEPGP